MSATGWISIKKGDCPVCREKGKEHSNNCQQSQTVLGLVLCRASQVDPTIQPLGYKHLGETQCGTWAKWIEVDEGYKQQWTEEQREKQRLEQQQHQEKLRRLEVERAARSLSADERHRWYSQILAELPVNQDLIEDWDARGFTSEEREASGFKSVVQSQKLKNAVDPRLPGSNADGTSLYVAEDGYLCPIRDPEGRIIGCQLRRSDPNCQHRYSWLSSKAQTLQLYPPGENPVAYFRPKGEPKTIAIVEGTGAKPFLVSQRYDAIAIGSPGQWLASPNLFRSYLETAYAEKGGERSLVIFPDAGDTANKPVINRWRKVAEFLSKEGWAFSFGWWGQVDKSCSDADELTQQEQAEISFISGNEFFSIADLGVKNAEAKKEQEQKRKEKQEQFQALAQARHSLVAITEKPYKVVNVPHMGEVLKDLLEPGTINIIISDTGTGKSESVVPLAEHAEAFYSWHNRISLGRMMSSTLKINYKDDVSRHNKTKAAFCAPSAYQFDPKALAKSGVLLLDECDQVFDFLFGLLCNKDGIRPLLLSTLEAHFESAMAGKGIALCMSADITQKDINYIKALAPEGVPVRLILNKYQPKRPTIQHDSSSSPDGLIGKLLEKLREQTPCFVLDDIKNGVKGCKSIAEFVRTTMPEIAELVLEIHADNTNDPRVKAFFENPDEESKKYLLIICSPSVISGLSMKNQRFIYGVFGFCNGVLVDREIKQFLNRVRGANDIYLWIAEEGFTVNGIDKKLTRPEEVKAYYQRNYEANSKHIISYKTEYKPITAEWDSCHFDLFCKNLLYRNLTMQHLRHFTLEHLQEIGYKIIDTNHIPEGGTKEIEDQLKATWTGIEIAEAEAIAAARLLSETELEALEFSQEAIPPEVLPSYRKTKLKQQFGEELIEATKFHHKKSDRDFTGYAAIALKNSRGDYGRQLDAFYLLSQDISESIARDYAAENRQDKRGYGRFSGDIRWNSSKRKCREFLGLPDFLDPEKWWQPSDYKELVEKAKRYASRIKDVLGFSVENIPGGQIFGELMRQVGLSFQTQSVTGEKWKLRKIKDEDWQYCQMYIQHKLAMKVESPVTESVAVIPTVNDEIAGFADLITEAVAEDRETYEAVVDGVNPRIVEGALQRISQEVRDRLAAFYHVPEPVQMSLDDIALQPIESQSFESQSIENTPETANTIEQDEIIRLVDREIQNASPLFTTQEPVTTWGRRLARAHLMGADIAKTIYGLVPQNYLRQIWQGLTVEVQNNYAGLFASG